ARVPHVGTPDACRVDHGQLLVVRLVDQLLDVADRYPGLGAAGIPPALDGLEDRLARLVAGKRVAHVDDEKRGPLAEAGARAISSGREDGLVALGEKLVPDRFGHRTPLVLMLNYSGLLSTDRLRCDSRGPPRSPGCPSRRTRSGSPTWRSS